MTRRDAINAIRTYAAQDGDAKRATAVYIENRVSMSVARAAIREGYAIHKATCKKPDCQSIAHCAEW